MVREQVARNPGKVVYRWLDGGGVETDSMTLADVWQRSGAIAQRLVAPPVSLRTGDTAMITFPIGIDFMPALLACMRVGVVAVSTYPPDLRRPGTEIPKFAAFVRDCGATVAITNAAFRRAAKAAALAGYSILGVQRWVTCDARARVAGERLPCDVEPKLEDAAFVQYTSGSTGDPKGVVISHAALAYTVAAVFRRFRAHTGVGWAPQYHDLGLVSNFISPVCNGLERVLFSPISFLRDPEMWPRAVAKYRAQAIAAPPFAFELVAKRMRASGNTYDLSSLRAVVIGAEPITPPVLDALRQLGVPESAWFMSYGMAEAVVWVSSTRQHAVDAASGRVACGDIAAAASVGSHIVIADPGTRAALPDGVEGRVYVSTPALARGYFNCAAITEQRFNNTITGVGGAGDGQEGVSAATQWYDTMDMGVVKGGQLFITGRASDLIIVAGRNLHPTDIERRAEDVMALQIRPGCSVAVQVSPSAAALFLEARPGTALPTPEQLSRLRAAVEADAGITISPVMVFPKGTLPKTTSGKVRRKECKIRYFNGSLGQPLAVTGVVPAFAAGAGASAAATTGPATPSAPPPATFDELLQRYGVVDMSRTLAENGVDSLRLALLIGEAQEAFGVRIDVSAVSSVPASQLELGVTGVAPVLVPPAADPGGDMWSKLPGTAVRRQLVRDLAPAQPTPPQPQRGLEANSGVVECGRGAGDGACDGASDGCKAASASGSGDDSVGDAGPGIHESQEVAVDIGAASDNCQQGCKPPTAAAAPSAGAKAGESVTTQRRRWSQPISHRVAACQAVLIAALVALVAASSMPAAMVHVEVAAWLQERPRLHEPWLTTFDGGPGLSLLLTPVTWMTVFTLVMVATKWAVVGRYTAGSHQPWSAGYMRWWFVDRLVTVWEEAVGVHLLGTPYLVLVYKALGCRHLPWSTRLDSFLREVDLVTVGVDVAVDGTVLCRLLSPAGLLLAPVNLQPHARVAGHTVVYPGEAVAGDLRSASDGDHNAVQRAVAPAVVLACVTGALYAASWCSIYVLRLAPDDAAGRTLACFLLVAAFLMLEVMAVCRWVRASFLLDRVYATGAGLLRVFLDYTPLPVLAAKGLGARIPLSSQLNMCKGAILPSTAHLVSAGANAALTSCTLRPRPQQPVSIGANAQIGTGAYVSAGVTIEAFAAVGSMAVVSEGCVVPARTVMLGTRAAAPGRDAAGAVVTLPARGWRPTVTPWWRVLGFTVCLAIVRAVVQWGPMAAAYTAVLHAARAVDALLHDNGAHAVVRTPVVMVVVMVLATVLLLAIVKVTTMCTVPAVTQWQAQHPGAVMASSPIRSVHAVTFGGLIALRVAVVTWLLRFAGGTWVINGVLRLLGAHVADVCDATVFGSVNDAPLLTIGRGVVVDRNTCVDAHLMEYGRVNWFTTRLEDGVTLHPGAAALGGQHLGEGLVVAARSMVWGRGRVGLECGGEHGVVTGVPAQPASAQPPPRWSASTDAQNPGQL